ncbi:beta strand repeat-containing protein [Longimicrobium sp.]|uniref:beta strand repeat-containing protein n=1 Tax=Longimicrobium sp. TaxID=2029185 RepID=UPI002C5696A9|nr:Ig-like domain-containing protein [Longimicrobium sp.]HSU16257.1 Ig-like domain-containing protein [Longimicrobium sp.]
MLRLKRAATLAAILAVAACTADSKSPTAPEAGPRKTISDAAHAGQVPGFYFLPPMVSQPSYSGTFDAALQPRVEICELSGTVCATTIATFTFGTGSDNVRLDAAGQSYNVNWHTAQSNLDPAKFYRISVYVGTVQLGYADVDVVGAAKDLRNVDTGQYIALLDDRTLPIKFRIETGIVGQVVVSPASDSVNVGETKQFTATLLDLHGNPVTGPTVTWTSSNPAVATIDATGLATGVDAGTVTITASIGYASGTATLKVIQPNTPPVANADTFQAIGNVTIPVSAPGVLANDTDTETPSGLSVVAGTVATANGGTATLAADGSFTYLSAAGFTGTDSFSYTVTDGSLTATGTVTMSVPNRVWYVSAGAAAGDGRDASPFATLTAAEGASAAGETIFLLYGDGSGLDTGFTFKNGQSLTGQGVAANVTATVNGGTVVLLAAGSAPTVTNASAGATLQLAQNNTAQGFNVNSTSGAGIAGSGFGTFTAGTMNVAAMGGPSLDLQNGTVAASFATLSSSNSAGAGLRLSGVGGTLAAPAGVVSNAAGAGVDVTGGNADVTYGGSISGSGTRAASVTGRTGGTLALSGDITDASGGILVQNNTGGTISFTGGSKSLSTGASNGVTLASNTGATIAFGGGGLAISTTSGTGFSATGGGTVTVTGAGNTVAASSGTAVRVANTTIGASGITFRSVSAANDANGIVLDNTGSNGFQVTGSGSAGSGGTIANMTGADGSTAGIGVYLNDTRNVTLSWMQINDASNFAIRGVDVQGFTLANSVINGVSGSNAVLHEAAVAFDGLTGSASVTGTSVAGGVEDNFRVTNTSGVLNRITFTNATFGGNAAATGRDGLSINASGGAVVNVTVQNSAFTSSRADHFRLTLAGGGSDLVFTSNTLGNAHPNPLSGGVAVDVSGAGAGTGLTYYINGNSIRDASGTAISVSKGVGAPTFTGTVSGNTIGLAAVANSGSAQGSGIDVRSLDGGTHTVLITGNQVRQYNNFGISLTAGNASVGGSGTLNATVTGNTVANPGTSGFPMNGVMLNAGTSTGDAHLVCLEMSGNSLVGSGAFGGTDFRLRQRMATTVRLPGYAGANNDNAAVVAFEQANNAGGPSGGAANTVPTGGGFVGGAGCPTP